MSPITPLLVEKREVVLRQIAEIEEALRGVPAQAEALRELQSRLAVLDDLIADAGEEEA